MTPGLSVEQYNALTAPLHPSRIARVQGMSHLEAWDVRRHLIRIFGFGGWDDEILSCDLVHESGVEKRKRDKQGAEYGDPYTAGTVVYRVTMRLVVKDCDGIPIAHYDDVATGDAVNQPSIGDAHDLALKSAMSQALKRCAVNLGDQFGLGLYNDGNAAATVLRSLVNPELRAEQRDGGTP